MSEDVLENALAQALDELTAIKKSNEEQKQLIKQLIERTESFEDTLERQKSTTSSIDICHLQAIMIKYLEQAQAKIMEQPKHIVRQFKILLFPEQNAREYYRLVFGKLLFWTMLFLLATYLFAIGKQFIEDWTMVREKKLEKTQCQNAWEYLYQHESSKGKKKMEDAWESSK